MSKPIQRYLELMEVLGYKQVINSSHLRVNKQETIFLTTYLCILYKNCVHMPVKHQIYCPYKCSILHLPCSVHLLCNTKFQVCILFKFAQYASFHYTTSQIWKHNCNTLDCIAFKTADSQNYKGNSSKGCVEKETRLLRNT